MALLSGKLAIVTGAGSGIGKAVCNLLAREGSKVIAADQNFKAAENTIQNLKGTDHIPLEIDVKSSISIDNALNIIKKRYSAPPTIVINSAGIVRDNFILKLNEIDFDKVIEINLKGTFLVNQYFAKELINAGLSNGSSFVNVGSIIGKIGNIGQCNYAASKAGVEALTKTAAKEFGQYGIRVNAVLPGFIETPMTENVPDKVKQKFVERISLQRMGKPNEVAEIILFLASDKTSYVNGASIEVTGGLN